MPPKNKFTKEEITAAATAAVRGGVDSQEWVDSEE